MKRKTLILTVAIFALIAVFTFAACMPKVTGGDANIAEDYDASEVNAKMDEMRTNGGLRLVFEGKADGEDSKDEVTYVYAANGDVYYFAVNEEQTYYDLSNAEYAAEYHKASADAEWSKTVTYYDASFTKADEEESIRTGAQSVFNWIGYYGEEGSDEDATDGGMAKETSEVAGRSCDKYSWGMSFMGVNVSYACWIDKATGFCLRWNASASAFGQGGGANFECKTFETSYSVPAMPQVSEENTTINQPSTDGTANGTILNDFPQIKNAVRALIATGVEAEFEITASDDDPFDVVLAAKGDLFYWSDSRNGVESYADLSDETKYVLYTRDDPDGSWTKEEYLYADENAEYSSKAELIAAFEGPLQSIYGLIDVAGNMELKKESTTYLGRDVFKYSGTTNYGVGTLTVNVYVDKDTGMVLFDSESSTGALNLNGSVECKSFKLGDEVTITLPVEE